MAEIYRTFLPDETATEQFAATLAQGILPGDLLALSGDLGAGKSTFARAFIRAACGSADVEVPSPTFTLVQTYTAADGTEIFHSDLYRLKGPEDIDDLGLEDERGASILLVEWPDRMPVDWWPDALKFEFLHHADGESSGRTVKVSAENPTWRDRVNILFGSQ